MKKFLTALALISLLLISACSNDNNEEDSTKDLNNDEKETIVFGQPGWSSSEVPTEIAKKILEEAGFDVEVSTLNQPIIFKALEDKEVDFFMDAWLPYTEEGLWEEYGDNMIKVSESYSEAPLGWVVPSYVEEDSIEDIKKNPDKFGGEVYTIDSGAGIATIAEEVMKDYDLDMYELINSSEGAMLAELETRIDNEEPVIITGWRPHSMFTQHDLKFLEEPNQNYKFDNIYVISYKEIEEVHPEAYDILSKWSIEMDDMEDMMYKNEMEDVSYEDLAEEWIEENRDQVDEMLGK